MIDTLEKENAIVPAQENDAQIVVPRCDEAVEETQQLAAIPTLSFDCSIGKDWFGVDFVTAVESINDFFDRCPCFYGNTVDDSCVCVEQ